MALEPMNFDVAPAETATKTTPGVARITMRAIADQVRESQKSGEPVRPSGLALASLAAGYAIRRMNEPDADSPAQRRLARHQAHLEAIAATIPPLPWDQENEDDPLVYPSPLPTIDNLVASLTLPLRADGSLDTTKEEQIINAFSRIFYHGIRVGSPLGERYFESVSSARTFFESQATQSICRVAVIQLQVLNGFLPHTFQDDEDDADDETADDAPPVVPPIEETASLPETQPAGTTPATEAAPQRDIEPGAAKPKKKRRKGKK